MRESALGLAPAKAGRQVSWAGENREVLSLAFGLTVPAQRKLPVSVLTVLPKGRLCVTYEVVLLLPMSLRLKVVETDALVASVLLNVIQFSLSRLLLRLYSMLMQ